MGGLALLTELKRRRVFRALIVYGVVAFALLQVVEPVMHGLHWPDVVLSYIVVALAIGFPVVVGLAWAFDVNSGAAERTLPAAERHERKIVPLALLGIGLLAAAPGVVWSFLWPGRLTLSIPHGSIGASAEPIPSIAVLPFVDMSPQRDQEYFSDGIAEEILNALAGIETLHVAGRTSSFSFKGKNEDLRSIGQKLNVGAVLEGSVRKAGSRVRITAQVVKADDGYRLWSETFDRELTDIFAVQNEIARAVAEALKVKLLSRRGRVVGGEMQTSSPEAHNQYLLGVQFNRQGSGDTYRRAEQAFRRAIALDPGYAMAYVGLSDALYGRYGAGDAESAAATVQLQDAAMAAAERAIALAPTLSDGHRQRGRMRMYRWDWTGAKKDLERALQLEPGASSALGILGYVVAIGGDLPRGLADLKRAAALDPLSAERLRFLGFLYQASGQPVLARDAFTRAVQVAPEHDWALFFLSTSLLVSGQPQEALDTMQRSRTEVWRLMGLGLAGRSLGREDESRQALARSIAGYGHIAGYQIAEVFAWRGERDDAMNWLERCYREGDGGLIYAPLDPLLRDLRGDYRFVALMKKINVPVK
jgi:TolB-like protein